jgi:hypothetical protein
MKGQDILQGTWDAYFSLYDMVIKKHKLLIIQQACNHQHTERLHIGFVGTLNTLYIISSS